MESRAKARAMRVAASPTVMLGVLLLLLSLTTKGAKGASCDVSQTVSQLYPCLAAVKSNPAPPSSQCCAVIDNTSSDCLCSCLQSPYAQLEGVDLQTALELPHKCKRVVPPGSKCGGYTIPSSS